MARGQSTSVGSTGTDGVPCRYPTLDYGGPAGVAQRLGAASGWKASGDLSFLNTWSYKLGAELLTPFGRGQLCQSM